MPNTETLRVPLWDGVDSAKLVGQRIFQSVAEEIALAGTAEDYFNNSSIDSDLWSVKTAGGGTVIETTQVDCDGFTGTDACALVFKKTPTNLRTSPGTYKIRFKHNAAATDTSVFTICQNATEPEPGIWNSTEAGYGGPHALRRDSDGKLLFRYYNLSQTLVYHDSVATVVGTTYVLIFETTATQWRFILKDEGETTTLKECAWVNWSDTYDDGKKDWIYISDMLTDYNYPDLSFYYASFTREYPTDSPSPGEQWESLPASSIIDMSTIRIPELMNSGDAGSIKFQYAKNGGALNGTWLTQEQLRAKADITVTDESESIKIVPQFISNGTEKATSAAYALVDVQLPYAIFQNPLEAMETGDMEVIEL
jgi:hypothetical protein